MATALQEPQELTDTEKKIIAAIAAGWTNKKVGNLLGISENGVKYKIHVTFGKLGFKSRGQLAAYGWQHGYRPPEPAAIETNAGPTLEELTGEGTRAEPALTPRQREVLALFPYGLTGKEIAGILPAKQRAKDGRPIGEQTVRTYRAQIYSRLGFKNAREAAAYAISKGIIAPEQIVTAAGYFNPLALKEELKGREAEIFRLIAQGKTTSQVTTTLGIGRSIVGYHAGNLMAMYGARNRIQLMLAAAQSGMAIELPAETAAESSRALTEREQDVLALIALGYTIKRIAAALEVKDNTARHHTSAVYSKLGVKGKAGAIAYVTKNGMPPKPGSHVPGDLEKKVS